MTTLPCGCEYDETEDAIYWNGIGPGGCVEHRPPLDPAPSGWRLALLDHRGKPIGPETLP